MRASRETMLHSVADRVGWSVTQKDAEWWQVNAPNGTWLYSGNVDDVLAFLTGAKMRDYYQKKGAPEDKR